jgi:hypothetical protein
MDNLVDSFFLVNKEVKRSHFALGPRIWRVEAMVTENSSWSSEPLWRRLTITQALFLMDELRYMYKHIYKLRVTGGVE